MLGQMRDEPAIPAIVGRLLLHHVPARDGVLFVPRPPGFGIEGPLLRQALQRAVILFEIEDAVALTEIEIGAVKFAAMGETFAEGLLRHFGVEDLALEVVDLGGLRPRGAGRAEHERRHQCRMHGHTPHADPRHGLVPTIRRPNPDVPTSVAVLILPDLRQQ